MNGDRLRRESIAVAGAVFLLLLGLTPLAGGPVADAAAATGAAPGRGALARDRLARPAAIGYRSPEGEARAFPLEEELLARLRGPWPRRRVFAAALLAEREGEAAWRQAIRYACCSCAPILVELGLDPKGVRAPLRLGDADRPEREIPCR